MRSIAAFLLLLVMTCAAGAQNLLGLPDALTQGGLYIGKAGPESAVWLGDRRLKLTPDGYFVFGVKARQSRIVKFRLVDKGGKSHLQRFMVRKQHYDVQRIDGLPQKMVTPPKKILARIAADASRVRTARTTDSSRQDFREHFIWPVRGRISGNFGNYRILNGIAKSPHGGMDIAAPKGSAIVAPLSGVITMVSDLYYTGNTVIIDHGFGVSTVFAHMDRLLVKAGQRVRQGQKIGTVGMTGRATGPHLHFGLNWYQQRLNPALVLDTQEKKQ